MPGDKRDSESWSETEFGLGEGVIDPVARAGRSIGPVDEMREIYALPKTFDGSMAERPEQSTTPVPRLLPGEEERDRG